MDIADTVTQRIQNIYFSIQKMKQENMLSDLEMSELIDKLNNCKPKEKETALNLLSIYLNSL